MIPQWTLSLEGGPRRVNHSAVIVDHRIFMFGGFCMGEDYATLHAIDVHVLNTNSCRWMKIPTENTYKLKSEVPFMRYGHASVAIEKNAFLFGGRNDILGASACQGLYCFNTEHFKWSKVKVKGDIPCGRDGHAMCVANGNIYVFGGFEVDTNRFSNDLFMLDMSTLAWQRISDEFNRCPSWRDFHTMTTCGDHIYVFGGRCNQHQSHYSQLDEFYDNTLMVFDTKMKSWSAAVCSDLSLPPGRRSHSAFTYKHCLFIFGGFNSVVYEHFNDLWKYDPVESKWENVKTLGSSPTARRRQCCCLYEDQLFMFGGTSPKSETTQQTDDEEELFDHNDTNVLDFAPTLKTLCFIVLLQYKVNLSSLPPILRWEAKVMSTPNSISKPLLHG
ncbi:kelch domain-containing protein 3-like [Clavelina lepadiformis]|uniref:Kelch domain-containing protein 3 n=1 Tax=Clavelina lepadiformis TaxID=159417 RepID=A0ABP0GLK7_CLALP